MNTLGCFQFWTQAIAVQFATRGVTSVIDLGHTIQDLLESTRHDIDSSNNAYFFTSVWYRCASGIKIAYHVSCEEEIPGQEVQYVDSGWEHALVFNVATFDLFVSRVNALSNRYAVPAYFPA